MKFQVWIFLELFEPWNKLIFDYSNFNPIIFLFALMLFVVWNFFLNPSQTVDLSSLHHITQFLSTMAEKNNNNKWSLSPKVWGKLWILNILVRVRHMYSCLHSTLSRVIFSVNPLIDIVLFHYFCHGWKLGYIMDKNGNRNKIRQLFFYKWNEATVYKQWLDKLSLKIY